MGWVGKGRWRQRDEGKRKPRNFKGSGASKMKIRNKMLKMVTEAKSFSINLWQSKNTKVFVPIRIYTDPLTKVLLIMQLASSPSFWLGSSLICHDHIGCTHLDTISSEKVPSLLPDHQSPYQHFAALRRQIPCWLQIALSPAPPQVSRRSRQ